MQRKEPFPGKIFTPCVPERRFAGLFGCIARISCHSQLILNTRRQYAATNWRFSRPKPLLGCMERKTCHGLPPGNAFREHFAIGKRPGTHRGEILPRQGTRERTAAESCRGKALGNASREYIATASQAKSASGRNPATVGRWGGTHRARILPLPVARLRSVLHARDWVQSLGCAVGFGAQHFLCEGVGIPPSRGLTVGNDFESALFRWATMSPLRVLRSCAVLCAEAKSALTFI